MKCHFNQVGWYRIAEYKGSNVAETRGASGNNISIIVKTAHNLMGNETFSAILHTSNGLSNITIIGKSWSYCVISKIRHTIDSTNLKSYLEIYYTLDMLNACTFELVHFQDAIGLKWKLIKPETTTETVDGIEIYSIANLEEQERQIMTRGDIAVLSGNPITNRTLPKQSTTINQLILQSGNYIITSYFAFKEGFPDLVDAIINVNGSDRITVRGTGYAGGGLTPVYICKITSTTTIESRAYQGSATEKEIDHNILTAIKLA